MSLSLHTLAPNPGSRTKTFRVGRGAGSGSGKTAGRGTKGQRSRAGGRNKLRLKGMKQMLLSFPKMRGFRSYQSKAKSISLAQLETLNDGTVVTLEGLRNVGLANRSVLAAKIVGNSGLTKKLVIGRGILLTTGAKAAIEKAGGSVQAKKKAPAKKKSS